MKYRFTLGERVDRTTNLAVNGDFDTDLSGWTVARGAWDAGDWLYATNGSGITLSLSQTNLFTIGQKYQIEISGTGRYWVSVGDYVKQEIRIEDVPYSFRQKCILGTDLNISTEQYPLSTTDIRLHYVHVYPVVWNDPLENEPIDWLKATVKKQRDEILNGLYTVFPSDLTFVGDGFNYIYNQYQVNGFFGDPIPFRIERLKNGFWEDFYIGSIKVDECTFDLSQRKVKCKIRDEGALLFLTERRKEQRNVFRPIEEDKEFAQALANIQLIDPTNENDYVTNAFALEVSMQRIFDTFKMLTLLGSDFEVGFLSDYFSGDFEDLMITNGASLDLVQYFADLSAIVSFEKVFNELDKIFDLSFSVEETDGVQYIRVEPKSYYIATAVSKYIKNISNLSFSLDDHLYKEVRVGFKSDIVNEESKNIKAEKSNAESGYPYIAQGVNFGDKKLNLVSDLLVNPVVIQSIYRNILRYETFDLWEVPTGWSISGGAAVGSIAYPTGPIASSMPLNPAQFVEPIEVGHTYQVSYEIFDYTSGDIKITGSASVRAANGFFLDTFTATDQNISFTMIAAPFVGKLRNIIVTDLGGEVTTYDNDLFLILTDGTKMQFTHTQFYAETIMTRHITSLNNGYCCHWKNKDMSESELDYHCIAKTNTAYPRIFKDVEFPLTDDDFDLFVRSFNILQFDSPEDHLSMLDGFILELERNIETGMCKATLVAEQ